MILIPYQVFWADFLEDLSLKIQSIYDWGSFDEYLNRSYNSEFSKDPFKDAMSNISDMANEVKKSGEDYVKKSLDFDWCYMSNKEIRGILYYYVTGYRMDITRSLKIDQWVYDSRKYNIDEDTVKKYCDKFAMCINVWPANLYTRCMEFFQKTYAAWQYSALMKQKVQASQLWSDKYWNNTTDDSPYDIIEDLSVLSKLLYQDAQDPIKLVFYDIPAFSNSKKSLIEDSNNSISNIEWSSSEAGWQSENPDFWDGEDQSEWDWEEFTEPWNGGAWKVVDEDLFSPSNYGEDLNYEDLLEWLGAYSLTSDGSELYTNLCDNREEIEKQTEDAQEEVTKNEESLDFDDLSEKQYQEIVDYMLNAVDQYSSLPSDKENEINEIAWDKSNYGSESSVEGLQKRIEEIKNCYKSCEDLHIDQKASCMIKCSCGEINSPIFDPEKTPGLWPIFMVRFCAVPAVNTKFSVWWKRIHSVEEWVREIYGVVDKLSREWRLWTWTQQYEFLDSSAKRIKFDASVAFSIDVEFVNIGNRKPKQSEQHQKKELKTENERDQVEFWVKNPLDRPETKNYNTIIPNENLSSLGNINENENKVTKEHLETRSRSYSLDVHEDIKAIHDVQLEAYWDLWLEQQWELRKNVSGYIADLKESASFLKNAKKKCKN